MSHASRVAAQALRLVPKNDVSRMMGKAASLRAPSPVLAQAIDAYCRVYRVPLEDYEIPPNGFRTFDEFFTRRIRAELRPIAAEPDIAVSPADGRLAEAGTITAGGTLEVKGRTYTIAGLLGPDVGVFGGGLFAVIYLSPRDYHRVHAPITGLVTRTRHIPGTLFPVNSIGLTYVEQLFARNERLGVWQRGDDGMEVVSLLVGATGVGRMSLSFDPLETNQGQTRAVTNVDPGFPVLQRGGELGAFHIGSTVILFFPPREGLRLETPIGTTVRMGEKLVSWQGVR